MDFISQPNVEIRGRGCGICLETLGLDATKSNVEVGGGSKSLTRDPSRRVLTATATMSLPADAAARQDPDFDFWDFVSCAVCHLPFSPPDRGPPPVPFWITECGHVLCNSHLSQHQLLWFTRCAVLMPSNRPQSELLKMW